MNELQSRRSEIAVPRQACLSAMASNQIPSKTGCTNVKRSACAISVEEVATPGRKDLFHC